LRIIVSSFRSPLHNLVVYLQKILHNSLPTSFSDIENSLDLIDKLADLYIPDDCALVSLDVISLFTNVPTELIIDIIDEKWSLIEKHSSFPKVELIRAIKLVLQSTFFVIIIITNKLSEFPWDLPSLIVADLVLQKLEFNVINKLSIKLIFYYRFVDDIALAALYSCLNDILYNFNSFHPRLCFTIEVGSNILNFLDLTIIKRDGQLIFNWYQKPTFSGHFLNFHSQHPFTHKKSYHKFN